MAVLIGVFVVLRRHAGPPGLEKIPPARSLKLVHTSEGLIYPDAQDLPLVPVIQVVDGDTLAIEWKGLVVKLRYFGVNTPEYKQPFAKEAKQFNTHLVRGKEVEVVQAKEKQDGYDGYGRLLAYVSVNDSLINARLLEEGLAYLFTFGPFAHYEEWLALQQRAQAQRKGMWREGVFGPLKITTLHANAKGNDRKNLNGEYVRVCNVSAKPVELAGFVHTQTFELMVMQYITSQISTTPPPSPPQRPTFYIPYTWSFCLKDPKSTNAAPI